MAGYLQTLGVGRVGGDVNQESLRKAPIGKDLSKRCSHTSRDCRVGAVHGTEIIERSILVPHSVTQQRCHDRSGCLGLSASLSL